MNCCRMPCVFHLFYETSFDPQEQFGASKYTKANTQIFVYHTIHSHTHNNHLKKQNMMFETIEKHIGYQQGIFQC